MRILCVHQGYELYGSDRCFIETVDAAVKSSHFSEVNAYIPEKGAILTPLQATNATVSIEPLWILRKSTLFRNPFKELIKLPKALYKAYLNHKKYDLIYINTLVVFDYILIGMLFSKKTIIHIHEVPTGFMLRFFQALIKLSRATIVFNSNATKAAYPLGKNQKSQVIYNGINPSTALTATAFSENDNLKLLILGRINAMKGHDVTLKAIAALPKNLQARTNLTICGGVFAENHHLLDNLKSLVGELKLEKNVTFLAFTENPRALVQNHHLILMPSTEPETLGRVAIEAMSEMRPSLVSNIGGLPETVENNLSGFIVEPNSSDAIKQKLELIFNSPRILQTMGEAALNRYNSIFHRTVIDKQMQDFLKEARDKEARDNV